MMSYPNEDTMETMFETATHFWKTEENGGGSPTHPIHVRTNTMKLVKSMYHYFNDEVSIEDSSFMNEYQSEANDFVSNPSDCCHKDRDQYIDQHGCEDYTNAAFTNKNSRLLMDDIERTKFNAEYQEEEYNYYCNRKTGATDPDPVRYPWWLFLQQPYMSNKLYFEYMHDSTNWRQSEDDSSEINDRKRELPQEMHQREEQLKKRHCNVRNINETNEENGVDITIHWDPLVTILEE